MTERKIDVLVAEDSAVTRLLLVRVLEADPRIRVIGTVNDGQAAVDFVKNRKPDIVLMDIHMPELDGFEATRRLMETVPLPIVMCSAISDPRDVVVAFEAMQAGALACIAKPAGPAHRDFDKMAAHLVDTVKLMSEVKVVRRSARGRPVPAPAPRNAEISRGACRVKAIAIGASTGGPPVLQTILAGLPRHFPVPLLIVQHIAAGFLPGMTDWLTTTTGFQVHVGTHDTYAKPGHVYVAPDDAHMGFSASGTLYLSQDKPENHVRPAVSFLFRSLVASCGAKTVGVLLTGMGSDGAEELKALKDKGSVTIAQDRESSIVHGMPGSAIALGGATHVLAADRIANALIKLVGADAR